MFAWQFAKALFTADRHGWTRFVSMQNHYNLLYREEEREMIPLCVDQGIGVIPWSPLARGRLAGRKGQSTERARGDAFAEELYDDAAEAVADSVEAVAGERGLSQAQVALAWLLQQPGVTAPIVGATRLEHVEAAVSGVDVALTADEMQRLELGYRPQAVRGHRKS